MNRSFVRFFFFSWIYSTANKNRNKTLDVKSRRVLSCFRKLWMYSECIRMTWDAAFCFQCTNMVQSMKHLHTHTWHTNTPDWCRQTQSTYTYWNMNANKFPVKRFSFGSFSWHERLSLLCMPYNFGWCCFYPFDQRHMWRMRTNIKHSTYNHTCFKRIRSVKPRYISSSLSARLFRRCHCIARSIDNREQQQK